MKNLLKLTLNTYKKLIYVTTLTREEIQNDDNSETNRTNIKP